MTKSYTIAVVGATGAVGAEIIKTLEQRHFPISHLYPLASQRSLGKTISFNGEDIDVINLETFDFKKTNIALFSAGGQVSKTYAPKAASAGCVVIDNSSHFRYDDDIPLVVSEVNPERIIDYKNRHIIANPNCSTMQLLVALKPLHDAATIVRINIATYQAVSGSGKRAIDLLARQTVALLSGDEIESDIYPARIAFNVIPHIDTFEENGYTREEMKIVWETQKILASPIAVAATAVRVPVFYGHSEAVYIETAQPLGADRARQILSEASGVCVIDNPAEAAYPMPSTHAAGNDEVFVGRIRDDLFSPTGINLWIVSDNIRKGAALNAVQIAEILAARYL